MKTGTKIEIRIPTVGANNGNIGIIEVIEVGKHFAYLKGKDCFFQMKISHVEYCLKYGDVFRIIKK